MVEHYKLKKWNCVGRRKKLKFGEVDLIFKFGQRLHFVEVKYLNNSWNIFERVSKDQKRHLIQNRVYYSLNYKEFQIESWIAFVSNPGTGPGTSNLDLIHLEE